MTKQNQATARGSANPGDISLEDFIEASVRGVMRAQAAQDDVSGYGSLDLAQLGGSLSFRFEVILCPPPPDQGVRVSPLPERHTFSTR